MLCNSNLLLLLSFSFIYFKSSLVLFFDNLLTICNMHKTSQTIFMYLSLKACQGYLKSKEILLFIKVYVLFLLRHCITLLYYITLHYLYYITLCYIILLEKIIPCSFLLQLLEHSIVLKLIMEKLDIDYLLKNIPIPPNESYLIKLVEKTESVVKRMRWRAHFFLQEKQYLVRRFRVYIKKHSTTMRTYGNIQKGIYRDNNKH